MKGEKKWCYQLTSGHSNWNELSLIVICIMKCWYSINILRIRFYKYVEVLVRKHVKTLEIIPVFSLNIIEIEGITDTSPQHYSDFGITNLSWQQKQIHRTIHNTLSNNLLINIWMHFTAMYWRDERTDTSRIQEPDRTRHNSPIPQVNGGTLFISFLQISGWLPEGSGI